MPFASNDRSPDDPFVAAADRARPLGLCPIGMLEDFFTNHWDHDSLCSGFGCVECVSTPEDFGYLESEDEVPYLVDPTPLGVGDEIPF